MPLPHMERYDLSLTRLARASQGCHLRAKLDV